ncbi:GGDEF domain-containing protein [Aliiruegeria sabulilitoris]|uniref:GGDEF domain-containing protein n=1 Tax=Aliiruegeria sabulilitoris TaxID=1510458 RepID=UPI00082CABD7|nr:sensor domain-containing diguanylate cyclase [Aliiruegeria sabulilitoris]NDR59653.1 GGDEF domain-containing protein [Pseudoruegeria sp. M32A2M]
MRFYDALDRIFPCSYAAKFGFVLVLALACPLLTAWLIPVNSAGGALVQIFAAIVGGIVAFRAILGLLSPLSRVAAALQRIEAGHRARLLPVGHRDELGLLMECTNRLATGLDTHLDLGSEKADRDSITGILNRRGVERLIPSLQFGAIILIDLDHFEQVNDRHGRHVGNRLLIEVADLLGDTVRQRDVLARFGEAEFLVCLTEVGMEQARQTADRIHRLIEDRIRVDGQVVTASIGVACRERDLADAKMFEAADRAMQAARESGRNNIVCAERLSSPSELMEDRPRVEGLVRGQGAQRVA